MLGLLKDSTGIADWLVGIGTFFLAIVALFASKIERWWFLPKLIILPLTKIVLSPEPQDSEGVQGTRPKPRFLVLLCVQNRGGLAEKAEVFVHSVIRKSAHGKDEPVNSIVPMSLRWSNREDPHPEVFVTISPGMQRYVILGALHHRPPTDHDPVYFELWTEFKLTQDSNELMSGEYIIKVYITASTAKPRSQNIRLTVPNSFKHPEIRI
jgi:hypothetical protein